MCVMTGNEPKNLGRCLDAIVNKTRGRYLNSLHPQEVVGGLGPQQISGVLPQTNISVDMKGNFIRTILAGVAIDNYTVLYTKKSTREDFHKLSAFPMLEKNSQILLSYVEPPCALKTIWE